MICQTTSSLPENGFIAGNRQILLFDCVDENNLPVDLTGSTIVFKMSPYGDADYVVVNKAGELISDSEFRVILETEDTQGLAGLYMFQTIVTDILNRELNPAQGTLFIQRAIK